MLKKLPGTSKKGRQTCGVPGNKPVPCGVCASVHVPPRKPVPHISAQAAKKVSRPFRFSARNHYLCLRLRKARTHPIARWAGGVRENFPQRDRATTYPMNP